MLLPLERSADHQVRYLHYCLQRELTLLVRLVLPRCQISVIKLAYYSFAMDAVPHQVVGRLEEVVSRLC